MARSDDGLSRRNFLLGSGAASTAALLHGGGRAEARGDKAGDPRALALGPGAVPVRFLVNGQEHGLKVEPRSTLVEVLRDQLGLTGTKIGCDRGACGACTVWVERRPVPSCMVLCLDVAGLPGGGAPRAVTTIEGLGQGQDKKLHPVQQAFLDQDALQCGFCTPGMIMSCAALLEQGAQGGAPLTEERIQDALAGNLCRCGTYPNVVAAVLHCKKGRR